jgi:endogenous inhibitor of DNA gyrase (YacG/DUF329 family)
MIFSQFSPPAELRAANFGVPASSGTGTPAGARIFQLRYERELNESFLSRRLFGDPAEFRRREAGFTRSRIQMYSWGMKWKCPICQKPTDSESTPDFPFCSERCRLTDLGNWASEKYKISEPVIDESLPDSRPPETGGRNPDEHED